MVIVLVACFIAAAIGFATGYTVVNRVRAVRAPATCQRCQGVALKSDRYRLAGMWYCGTCWRELLRMGRV
jgi:late competence protein required for DNA uptake (superfamily II DNA/RNA helicase)